MTSSTGSVEAHQRRFRKAERSTYGCSEGLPAHGLSREPSMSSSVVLRSDAQPKAVADAD
jgi:hypothetical protein